MAYVVGQAEVLVFPNAQRFQEELGRQITPTAKRVGRDVGDELSRQAAQGLTRGLQEGGRTAGAQGEQVGGSFASGFQKRLKAALASLPDATVQLNVRDTAQLDRLRAELVALSTKRIGIDVSAEEAHARVQRLQAQLTELSSRSTHVQLRIDTAAASTELAKFRAEMGLVGDGAGTEITKNAAKAAGRGSPLIVAAISGGLIAGAPAVLAAGTLLFGGIAAASVSSQKVVTDATARLANDTMGVFKTAAAQTAPVFAAALDRISAAVLSLEPQLNSLFSGLSEPISLLTTGIINLVQNAMPGLTAAVKASGPVFQGLADLLGSIGTGISDFFSILAQHAPAAGTVFSSLGTAVQNLLPILGELVGAGVELASQVLPPLASALGLVNSVIQGIAPALPGILAAFLGFKAVGIVSGLLGGLGNALSGMSDSMGAAAGGSSALSDALGKAGDTVSSLSEKAGPILGAAIGATLFVVEQAKQQINDWAQAMLDGGAAAEQATQQIQQQTAFLTQGASGFGNQVFGITNYATALGVGANASKNATQAAKDLYDAMTPLQQKQQDVTTAQNDYLLAVDKWGPKSGQAVAASFALRDAQDALTQQQLILKAGQDGVTLATEQNITRLQGLATNASNANTQITLLKGALDALTGTAITADQAQIAVTTSIEAAKHALDGQRDAAGNLTSALTDNTGQLDLNTAAGAAAATALINLSGTMHQQIATLEQQGATADAVAAKTDQLRQQFYDQARQMGLNDAAAQALTDRYFGIPDQVKTEITADTNTAQAVIDKFVAGINSQGLIGIIRTIGGHADGGYISGPGTGRSDSIPAMLSNGEYVINAEATAQHRPLLEAINSKAVPAFADGGYVNYPSDADFIGFTDMTAAAKGKLAAAKAKAAASFSGDAAAGVGLAGSINRALGLTIANSMGYGGQFSAIDYIFSHESGWRNTAQNPTSTAYGIPQFLNSTWGAYGGKTSDPATQIRDGIRYMVDRYGSPNAAASFWKSHHWYHDGGVVQGPAGANVPAILQAGETVLTPAQRAAMEGNGVAGMRIAGTLDLGNGLEARMEAVIVDALTVAVSR